MTGTPSTIKKRIVRINKLYASLSVSAKKAPTNKTSTKRECYKICRSSRAIIDMALSCCYNNTTRCNFRKCRVSSIT